MIRVRVRERLSATPGHVIGQGPAPGGQIVPCGGDLVAGTGPSDQLGMYCKTYYRRINGLRVSRAISQMSFFTGMAGPDPRANAHRRGNARRHPAEEGDDLKSC